MFKRFSAVAVAFAAVVVYSMSAQAQDVVFAVPAAPGSAGPILTWVMTVAGSMITLFVPLVAVWFRRYLNVQNAHAEVSTDQSRSQMIDGAIVRAAHIANAEMTANNLTMANVDINSPTMQRAMTFVADSHPDAIAATPQATDEHIADSITAELSRIQNEKVGSPVPTVVLSPVSAVR